MSLLVTLHYQRQSPYCRKVIVMAHETGLFDTMRLVEHATSPLISNSALCDINPLGKVPVLQHNDVPLFDSVNICAYLDQLHGTPTLYGSSLEQAVLVNNYQALADGICDAGILIKQAREQRSVNSRAGFFEQGQIAKITKVTGYFESLNEFYLEPLHLGHIALACALDWLDFAKIQIEFAQRPKLSQWKRDFLHRSSMQNTAYQGETDDGFTYQRMLEQARLAAF